MCFELSLKAPPFSLSHISNVLASAFVSTQFFLPTRCIGFSLGIEYVF